MTQVKSHETHISAQQNQARTHPRLSCSHGHQGWAPSDKAPPRKRSRAVDAVTHRTSATTTSNNSRLTSSGSSRFRKENRLLDAAAFGRVFQKATRSRDKLFTVLCIGNEEGAPRLGLAISKKFCRRATARNRIKRLIRESFRQHQVSLAGLDIVVINQPAAASANNYQIVDSLEAHWHRCKKAKRTPQES
jgi:ribonuclease P protein component